MKRPTKYRHQYKKTHRKKAKKVHQPYGRLIQKYPTAAKFYTKAVMCEKETVVQIDCQKNKSYQNDDHELGCYFIKTNLDTENELSLWQIYNSIRQLESTFICLKINLDQRDIPQKRRCNHCAFAFRNIGIVDGKHDLASTQTTQNHSWLARNYPNQRHSKNNHNL